MDNLENGVTLTVWFGLPYTELTEKKSCQRCKKEDKSYDQVNEIYLLFRTEVFHCSFPAPIKNKNCLSSHIETRKHFNQPQLPVRQGVGNTFRWQYVLCVFIKYVNIKYLQEYWDSVIFATVLAHTVLSFLVFIWGVCVCARNLFVLICRSHNKVSGCCCFPFFRCWLVNSVLQIRLVLVKIRSPPLLPLHRHAHPYPHALKFCLL